jgi:hypothetical protein
MACKRLNILHKSRFQQGCILGSSDGTMSIILPVSEKLYRRLYSLYSRMVTSLQHAAGLNPRGYRYFSKLI